MAIIKKIKDAADKAASNAKTQAERRNTAAQQAQKKATSVANISTQRNPTTNKRTRNKQSKNTPSQAVRKLAGQAITTYHRTKSAAQGPAPSSKKYGNNKQVGANLSHSALRAAELAVEPSFVASRLKRTAPFLDWIHGRPRTYDEDKGTTLAQVNRLAALYDAIYPTTKGYSAQQARELQAAIRNAPVALQDAFIRYGEGLYPMDPYLQEGHTAYYSPSSGKVHGRTQAIAEGDFDRAPYQTHWHEYGHNLDHLSSPYKIDRGKFSSTYNRGEFSNIIENDIDNTLRDYWARFGEGEPYDRNKALTSFRFNAAEASPAWDTSALSDIISPYSYKYTGNAFPMGVGHSGEYWDRDPRTEQKEAFADMTAAAVLGGQPLRYVQAVLPNSYEAYLDMLTRMNKR